MSAEVNCKECGFANPAGAKFCSNCGAKLPIGTKILCINCNTINPGDRVFCDNCGVRLQTDPYNEQGGDEDEKKPGGTAPFSLPMRPPGQTGELDPNKLPEWLRTGETQPISDEDEEDAAENDAPRDPRLEPIDTSELPKIEDLTPEKRLTDDLPDWLVDDADSQPIIASPEQISTEMYLDLIGQAGESLDLGDDFEDDAGAPDLPDWLSAADQMEDAPDSAELKADDEDDLADETADDAEIPDWLSALAEPDDADSDAESDVSFSESGLTDWLTAVDDTPSAAQPEEEDDWLEPAGAEDDFQSSPGLTELLRTAGGDPPPPDADEAEDWFAGTDAEISPSAEAEDEAGAGLTDWLSELHDLAHTNEKPSTDSDWFADLAAAEDDESSQDALADWLQDEEEAADIEISPILPSEGGIADEISRTLAAEDRDNVATDFTDLFEVSSESTDLPDWLADVVAEGESFVEEEADSAALDSLFSREEAAAQSELDWLMQTGSIKLPATDDTDEEAIQDAPLMEQDAADFDWLSDLAAIDSGSPPPDEPDAQPEAAAGFDSDADTVEEIAETTEATASEPLSESFNTDDFLASESPVTEDLPDWLGSLDSQAADLAMDQESEGEGLPEWLQDEGEGETDAVSFSSVLSADEEDEADPLAGIPKELVSADLPDWLRDGEGTTQAPPPASTVEPESEVELPEWMSDAPALEEEGLAAQEDWGALLDELPPPDAQGDAAQALPEWIQDLRPDSLEEESISFFDEDDFGELEEEEAVAETHGPLAGIVGAIPVAPAATMAHEIGPAAALVVSPEERKQAALLQQLLLAPAAPRQTADAARALVSENSWLRLLLAVLLLAIMGAALFVPLPTLNTTVNMESAAAVQAQIEAAAGQPVLVAFEFTPAFSGELSPQATAVLAQLAENESPIVTISQHTAGTALASATRGDYTGADLGYLPGGAVGLRQLSNCLTNGAETCHSAFLDAPIDYLENISLIIVFTSERDSLLGWIEQVGSQTNIPLVAGIANALSPVAAPYADSGQLRGVIDGAPGTATYLAEIGAGDNLPLRRQLTAQTAGQLLAAVLLLVGLIVGLARSTSRGNTGSA